jgi:hypothetical protein
MPAVALASPMIFTYEMRADHAPPVQGRVVEK